MYWIIDLRAKSGPRVGQIPNIFFVVLTFTYICPHYVKKNNVAIEQLEKVISTFSIIYIVPIPHRE